MKVQKRDSTSGLIRFSVDTRALTPDERAFLNEELHEWVLEQKSKEALDIMNRGIGSQLRYLMRRRGEENVADIVLGALDAVDNRRQLR